MPIIYNIEPARNDLFAKKGNSINMNFQVSSETTSLANLKFYINAHSIPISGIPYHMDQLVMYVRRKDGLLLKEWRSGVTPSDILINPSVDGEFNLFDAAGFSESGHFDYDLNHDTGTELYTMGTGSFFVTK
jgi:hypothetical protein